MRYVSWWLAGTALLTTLGCAGGGSTPLAPANPTAGTDQTLPAALSVSGALGAPMIQGDLTTSALAIYNVQIDPATMQATSSLKETRSGQANDDIYMLSIDSFLTASSFVVTGLSADVDTIGLSYSVTHPFPAPNNPTGTPNGSTNRADLGVAGMVLFLADVPSATGNTYFTDVVANTELVANADAYFAPAGCLTTTGTANTFPYLQLVDELQDPRSSASNSGDVEGNFGSDGWTRSEFGGTNDQWTGFGVMHQGQTVSNMVSLNKAALSGGFSLDVAIISKYNDPRGGTTGAQKKANRLPPASADASLFAYRMPHGALDVSRIRVAAEPAGFIANTISGAQISAHVEDWDARATETAAADLSEDTAFGTVAVGAAGVPTVEVCIPDVLGDATVTAAVATVVDDDSAYGGDVDQDSGAPGDSLFFSELITKTAGSGQVDGFYTGMIRAVDPLADFIALDEALAPAGSPPNNETFQAFTIEMLPDNAAPTATYTLNSATVNENCAFGLTINAPNDDDGDAIDVLVDWDDDGTYTLMTSITSPYPLTVPVAAPSGYVFSGPAPDIRDLPVRIADADVTVDLTPTLTFEVLQNCPTAPFVATPLTTGLGYTGTGGFWSFSATFHPQDVEGMKSTIVGPQGGIFTQRKDGLGGNFVVFLSTAAAPNAGASTFTVTSGVPVTLQANQMDTSGTNRMFYSTYITSQIASGRQNPAYTYGATGGAANITFFDLTGTVPFASFQTISTGANRVVAMDVDSAGNVWYVDTANVLHKMEPTGATTYAEDTTCPYPIDLKTISQPMDPLGGTAATNIKIHDFEVSNYSGSIYILAQSQEAAAANGYIYKVACDGSSSSRSAGFALNYSTSQNQSGDIHIDDRNTTGGLISPISNSDAQIAVFCNRMIPNTDIEPEMRIFSANLTQSTSFNWNPFGCCDVAFNNGTVALNNWAYAPLGPSFGTGVVGVWGTAGNFPPTGWL